MRRVDQNGSRTLATIAEDSGLEYNYTASATGIREGGKTKKKKKK